MRGDPYLARLLARAVLGFGGPKRKIRGQDSPVEWKRSAGV
jgi:hypothetical protein